VGRLGHLDPPQHQERARQWRESPLTQRSVVRPRAAVSKSDAAAGVGGLSHVAATPQGRRTNVLPLDRRVRQPARRGRRAQRSAAEDDPRAHPARAPLVPTTQQTGKRPAAPTMVAVWGPCRRGARHRGATPADGSGTPDPPRTRSAAKKQQHNGRGRSRSNHVLGKLNDAGEKPTSPGAAPDPPPTSSATKKKKQNGGGRRRNHHDL